MANCDLKWETRVLKKFMEKRREIHEPCEGYAFEGSGEHFAQDRIFACIQANLGKVGMYMVIWVSIAIIHIHVECLPSLGKRCIHNTIYERMSP